MEGQTGTRNETYDLVAVLYHALQGVENCQRYASDAQGDEQLGQFFRQAGDQQRQLAEQAKQMLQQCLGREQGGEKGGSAFSFSQQGSEQIGGQSMGQGETGSTGMGRRDEMAGGQAGGMGGGSGQSSGY